MDTAQIVLAAIAAIGALAAVGIGIAALASSKRPAGADNEQLDRITDNLQEAVQMIKEYTEASDKQTREILVQAIASSNNAMIATLQPYMNTFSKQIDSVLDKIERNLGEIRAQMQTGIQAIGVQLNRELSEVRKENGDTLERLRRDNREQLETMRATVDEKLSETLDTRVKNAFQLVSERLDAVQKGFGEMRELSSQVGNLNRVFTNVKTRGGWGEVSLESLLEQILSPEQYRKQFQINRRSQERVDFAIVMPGQAGETVYLPMDAKFPMDAYERLVDASEHGNSDDIARARRNLIDSVKTQARSIRDKYIKPPATTNFAILYLPVEGLYAEVVKNGALVSDLQTDLRVTVCGPTTLAALLNSLQTGFNTLKIQKRSGEIVRLMGAFRKDFSTFTELIGKVRSNAEKVVSSLDQVDKRNDIICKKLSKVDVTDYPELGDATQVAADWIQGDASED